MKTFTRDRYGKALYDGAECNRSNTCDTLGVFTRMVLLSLWRRDKGMNAEEGRHAIWNGRVVFQEGEETTRRGRGGRVKFLPARRADFNSSIFFCNGSRLCGPPSSGAGRRFTGIDLGASPTSPWWSELSAAAASVAAAFDRNVRWCHVDVNAAATAARPAALARGDTVAALRYAAHHIVV